MRTLWKFKLPYKVGLFREKVRFKLFGPRRFFRYWAVDTDLCRYLGNTMVEWADKAHGHPIGVSYEEWTGTLRKHATTLLEYAEDDEDDEEKAEAAKAALHWVADNLRSLWD